MTQQTRNRRIAALRTADAINKVEGVAVSRYARSLSEQWVKGEISGAQMRDALIAAHKRPTFETKR